MPTKFHHDWYGECELVRIEGVDWIIRCCDSGQTYRVPSSRRQGFTPIVGCNAAIAAAPKEPDSASASRTHTVAGGVSLLLSAIRSVNRPPRDDIGRSASVDSVASHAANHAAPHRIATSSESEPSVNGKPPGLDVHSLPVVDETREADKRRLRKVFESLRNGLSPIHVDSRPFAVGIEAIQQKVQNLLLDVAADGGRAVVIRGTYGQGKSFCLQLLKQMALESGYAVASVEVDAFENQLDKPHLVYRSLMGSLQFPDGDTHGVSGLADRVSKKLSQVLAHRKLKEPGFATEARRLLDIEIQCRPLAWLLSDPGLLGKPRLLDLLASAPGVQLAPARRSHILQGQPRDWPAFSAGTQGDFGSYLLSGLGRTTRFLGHKGLILILDEMEKWQDLNWRAQSCAGNLLGGLIWASTAEVGTRNCKKISLRCDHSRSLAHSMRCCGYPFSTPDRCYLGVAIAMTPRGDDGPEKLWSDYGLLEIADLPPFTPSHLESYARKVFPAYCRAYGIEAAMPSELPASAIKSWRLRGDGSTRTAVQSVLSVLDNWRQTLVCKEV